MRDIWSGRVVGRFGLVAERRIQMVALFVGIASALISAAPALGEEQPSSLAAPAEGTGASSSLGGPLVISGLPTAGEELQTAHEAGLASPEAAAAREASHTRYENEDQAQVLQTLGETLPTVVDRQDGGPPPLAAGERSLGFISANLEQVETGAGEVDVVQTAAPVAVSSGNGHWDVVDLTPQEANGGFEARRPLVAVRIPKHLGEGAQIPSVGVSLTPVDANGNPLGGSEGVADGQGVVFANTQTDTDTVLKSSLFGVEATSVLRSAAAPEVLYYRVGMPQGARLIASADGLGATIVDEGVAIAHVKPPAASDAEGTAVPVSMSVSHGDMLVVTVDHSGSFRDPIEVDPEVVDHNTGGGGGNWRQVHYGNMGEYQEHYVGGEPVYEWEVHLGGAIKETWTSVEYPTQGKSHIVSFYAETAASDPPAIENRMTIFGPGGSEANETLPSSYAATGHTLSNGGTGAEDVAEYIQYGKTTETGEGTNRFAKAAVTISQSEGPHVSFNTTSPTTYEGLSNALYTKGWVGPHADIEFNSSDPGIGVSKWQSGGQGWNFEESNFCGVQCPATFNRTLNAHPIPDGEGTVEAKVWDAVGLSATAVTPEKVKVDGTPPYNVTLAGLPKNDEIGNEQYHLTANATDGSGTTPSSGVASMALAVDGKEVRRSGACSPGPCTATTEWAISGTEFAVGPHTLSVTATDNAGNVAKIEQPLFVARPTTPVSAGPGSVNPQSGELTLSAADVSIGAPGASLTVLRSYGSLHLQAGVEGPLGPQWTLGLGASQNVTKLSNGNVLLTSGNGLQSVFASKGNGEYAPPRGDEGLKLKEEAATKEFVLSSTAGAVTKFSLAPGSSSIWVPSVSEGPAGTSVMKTTYQTVSGVTEPVREIAPAPRGVSSCSPTLEKGCRALEFVYATSTTATGNGQSEWGEYNGRLKEIVFIAWEPSGGERKIAVADYSYDSQGRLRAEWDPRVSPALKTTYGYDSEGHVTAVSPPAQQPWLLTYGSIAGDTRTGRLLAVTRPTASTSLGNGVAPVNSSAPSLSTTSPAAGNTMSVSTGAWSNSPLSYTYKWEECVGEKGKETCSPILGATNQTYTPLPHTTEYSLVVQVTATDSDGSTTVFSNQSGHVGSPTKGFFEEKTRFGTSGSGKLSKPSGVAVDASGNVWVADTGNNRIVKFSSAGTYLAAYGKEGSGEVQFKEPKGIAIDKNGNVFVADTGNSRIEILSSFGKYIGQRTTGAAPTGIAIGESKESGSSAEEVYVTVPSKNDWEACQVTNGAFGYCNKFGKEGSGNDEFKTPSAVTTGAAVTEHGKNIYITDTGNHRVQYFQAPSPIAIYFGVVTYLGQFGKEGKGEGQFSTPENLAFEPEGLTNEWTKQLAGGLFVTDAGNSRMQQFSNGGTYENKYGLGSGGQAVVFNPVKGETQGDMYVASSSESYVQQWAPSAPQSPSPEPPNPGGSAVTTIDYHVPVSGAGAPYLMGSKEVEAWGQTDVPSEVTAVFPPDEPMGWPAKDYKRATLYYLDSPGHTVNVAAPSGAITTTEYNATGDVARTLSPGNRAAALAEGCESKEKCKSAEVAKLLDTENTYNKEGTELEKTLGPQHTVKLVSGSQVQARGDTQYFYNEGAPSEGGPYSLVTKMTESALVSGKEEEARETTTSYAGQTNLGWKLRKPTSITTNPSGLKLTHTISYEASSGEVTEARMPASPGENSPHDTQTIYYTTATNSTYPRCGEHPEWAGLVCQTQPAKQPETSGLPNLPVVDTTYNIWDEPVKTTETIGSTNRTKTATYDAAGRLQTSGVTSSVGTALPSVTDEYSSETGLPVKQCANEGKPCTEGKPKTITGVYNSLGELTSYADAAENTTTYEYDIDGRPQKINTGKGVESLEYNTTTGLPTKLVNENGTTKLTFTAAYDPEGNLLAESYPNGMNADYTYDQTGKPTRLEYIKTTDCTEKCTWFSDSAVPSIHGQWLEQTSTLSHQAYTYDTAGRLEQVQNTPAGKGCITRIYAYDSDANRTSLTTREPNSKGECATEGGVVEKHTYDTADRLTDSGISYNTFGDIATLAASDAGGSELKNEFYVDNQLQSETQNGQTIAYNLDPAGRTNETVMTGKRAETVVSNYAGPGSAPSWTVNTSGETTRNIPGINGQLAAVQNGTEVPVLQLPNLHGDIIATANLSETATSLASTTDTSEFGVPTTSLPPKYSWLGAGEIPTELPSGIVNMGVRSYVPQLGRFLQPDPRPAGSANNYTYTFGDPVNTFDPTGEYTATPTWAIEFNNHQAHAATEAYEAAIRRAAEEAAAKIAAEQAAREAAWAAAVAGPIFGGEEGGGGEEEWYEEEYEEEGAEYAAYHGEEGGKGEAHAEAATLDEQGASFGPGMELQGEGTAKTASSHSVIPLCKGRSEVVQAPCTRYVNLWDEFKHEVGRAWHWFKKHVVHPVTHWVSEQWRAFKEKVSLLCPPFQMRVGGQCLEPSINLREFPTAEG